MTEFTNATPILVTNGGTHGGVVDGNQIDYYRFPVSAGAVQANFEILPNPSGNVDLLLAPAPVLPTPTNFLYASTNAGTNSEFVVVHGASAPVPLSPGDWLVAVVNRETNAVAYNVRFTEFVPNALDGRLTQLTNGVPYFHTNSPLSFAADYYVYRVSSAAQRAQFEVLQPSEDVTLIARRGVPLPGLSSFDYRSANRGTNDEFIVLARNSVPVPLAAGDWYLAVLHATTNAVTYTIRGSETALGGSNLVIVRSLLTTNAFCLTWSNALVGVNYFVQGKPDLEAPVWFPVSTNMIATTTEMTYCVPRPTPHHFFRIVDGFAPSLETNLVRIGSAGFATNGFELRWTNSAGLPFAVQWTRQMGTWRWFTNIITSTNTNYLFLDDGSQTGGPGSSRFYRVLLAP
jgi:hypothetical protein